MPPPTTELASHIAQRVISNFTARHPRLNLSNNQLEALQACCKSLPHSTALAKALKRRDGKTTILQEIAGAVVQEWPSDDEVQVYVFTLDQKKARTWKIALSRMFTQSVLDKIHIKFMEFTWKEEAFMSRQMKGSLIFIVDEVVTYVPELLVHLCTTYPQSSTVALFSPTVEWITTSPSEQALPSPPSAHAPPES